ncbi:uncharacterized protein LOC122625900 [Drosophila teissieri]|uniref:uncharacterized protein LOC122625900 n=1 Tax=Drosophila teissieri TaxID=7243 RepID=UPI001CB9E910|nr:uncharacterized protein LOC122625900 [Drosophila teissieri]
MELTFQLILVSFIVFASAATNTGSSYRYTCNANTGQYKCTYELCTKTLGGKQNCTSSVSFPKNTSIATQGSSSSYKYSCAWDTGVYKCTHIRCSHYFNGQIKCTTSQTTPYT